MAEMPPDPGQVDTTRGAPRVVSRVNTKTSLRIRTLEESGHRVGVSFRHKMVLAFGLSMLVVGGLTFLGVRGRARADVYSMGQTLYFLLSGTLVKMRQTGYVPLSERLAGAGASAPPAGMDGVLRRALEPDPTARFESMEAMRLAIARL